MAKKKFEDEVVSQPSQPHPESTPRTVLAAARPITAILEPPVNAFGPNGYPLCQVPNSVNAVHDGGGELGLVFYVDPTASQSDYTFMCRACSDVLSVQLAGRVIFPLQGDGKSDFC